MTQITENKLATKVRDAILNHEAYKETWRIDILEDGSVITLLGSVPAKDDLNFLETIAKQQEGVVSVINELDVKPDGQAGKTEDTEGHHIRILPPRR